MTSSDTITMKWDGTIVLLSIFTAFIGSYSTVILYEQYRLCSRENRPKLLSPHMLLVLMAISLGGIAIWTMHFVAMSSVKMYQSNGDEIIVRYRQDYTLISLFVVILFCYIGLRIGSYDSAFKDDKHDAIQKFMHDARTLTIDEIRRIKNVKIFILSRLFQNISVLLCSGMITATGVCIMHYLGMEAMSFKGYIVWNKGIVAASVLIAIVAATAAVWILYRLLSFFPNIEMLRFLCSVVAAIAVNGMHYCGQAAATFHYVSDKKQVPHTQSFDQQNSTIVAIVVSAVFLFTVLIISISDLRMWYNNNIQLLRELDLRAIMAKGNVLYENEKFLNEYDELRSKTRSERDNQAFQLKIKLRKSDSNSNSQTSEAATSSYYETATDLDPQISANYKIHIDDPDNNRSS